MIAQPHTCGEIVARLRDEHHLLTVPAGQNVIRLLPPLIVSDAEIDQALAGLECGRRSPTGLSALPVQNSGARPSSMTHHPIRQGYHSMTRHFLDLKDVSSHGPAHHSSTAPRPSRQRASAGSEKRPLAGKTLGHDLREALNPYTGLI